MAAILLLLNLWLTVILSVISFNGLGKYNIGGVPNSTTNKLFIFAGWLVIYVIWLFYFELVEINIDVVVN